MNRSCFIAVFFAECYFLPRLSPFRASLPFEVSLNSCCAVEKMRARRSFVLQFTFAESSWASWFHEGVFLSAAYTQIKMKWEVASLVASYFFLSSFALIELFGRMQIYDAYPCFREKQACFRVFGSLWNASWCYFASLFYENSLNAFNAASFTQLVS